MKRQLVTQYFVKFSLPDGSTSRGLPTSASTASDWVKAMNAKHSDILHWVAEETIEIYTPVGTDPELHYFAEHSENRAQA